jgi:GTP-dependent phosphoenolpyruvate carboxykinase
MGPDSIFVCDGSDADYAYIREKALKMERRRSWQKMAIQSILTASMTRQGIKNELNSWFLKGLASERG